MNLLDWWSQTRAGWQPESETVRALRTAVLEPRLLLNAAPVDAAAIEPAPEQVALIDDPAAFVAEMNASQSGQQSRRELVLIDRRTPDADELLSLLEQTTAEREIVWIENDHNLDDVTDAIRDAASGDAFDAIHLLSHGDELGFAIGSTRIDGGSIESLATNLDGWRDLFTTDGDFLIYGCSVAETSQGQSLLRDVASFTGADIAANTGMTGTSQYGGDWTLDFTVGSLETTVLSADGWNHLLTNVTVTNASDVVNGTTTSIAALIASDGGDGISLREAILAAGNTAGHDTINFAIGTGQRDISITSALPTLDDLTIDATTQPGYAGSPLIMLQPNGGYTGAGLTLQDNVTVKGLAITNFTGNGIDVLGANNTIQGTWIGVDHGGSARGNSGAGIALFGSGEANNVIGGLGVNESNTIAHNSGGGIFVSSGTDHFFRDNAIHSNSGLGSVVFGTATSSSDWDDADTGQNNLLNQPEILAVVPDGTNYKVQVYVQSVPNTTVTLDLLAALSANSRESLATLAAADVTTNGDGFAVHEFTVAAASLPAGTQAFSAQILSPEGSSFFAQSVGLPSAGVGATATYSIPGSTVNDPDFRGERRTSTRPVAVANDGRRFVVWTENDGAGSSIWGRLISADGTTATAATQISESAGTHHDASVSVDASGRFVVVWAEQDNQYGKFRLINADGTVNGSEQDLYGAGSLGATQYELDVVSVPTGEFYVVWSSTVFSNTELYIHRYDADGNSTMFPDTLTEGLGDSPRESSLDINKDGVALITWEEDDGIHIRTYNTLTDTSLSSDTLLGNGDDVVVTALSDGRFFLAISDATSGTPELYGQFLNSDGTTDGARFRIDESVGPNGATTPSVSADMAGRIAIGYENGNGQNAYYKIIDSTGATVVAESDVPLDTGGHQDATIVAFAPGTETLWLSYHGRHAPASPNDSIYSRAVSVPLANTPPVVDTGGPYTIQRGAPITLDASGTYDPDGDPLTFAWDLDNDGNFGEVNESTSETETVSWGTLTMFGINNPGVYTIGLRVSDGHGAVVDLTSIQVLVNGDPIADAGGPYVVQVGGNVTLDASGSTDPNSDPLTYRWDLNNDSTYGDVTGESPVVTWSTLGTYGITAPGSYTIGLEADDAQGGTHTTTATLNVTAVTAVHESAANNPDFRGDNRSSSRTVAVAPDGKYYVVWTEDDGAGSSVYGRLFNADGSAATGALKLNESAGNHRDASVSVDASGEFVASWHNPDVGNGFFRLIRADGSLRLYEREIDLGGYSNDREFDVVKLSSGEIVFTFNAQLFGQEDQHIVRYDSDGLWASGSGAHALSSGFGDDPSRGVLAANSSGIVATAWIEPGGVHIRRYNANDHTVVDSDTVISTGSEVAIASLSDGRWFLAINDGDQIFGQFLNSDTTADGARFRIDEGGGPSGMAAPTIAVDANDRIAIGYQSANGNEAYYKVIDNSGATVVAQSQAPENIDGDQRATNVAFVPGGNTLLLTYEGDNNTVGEDGVWVRSVTIPAFTNDPPVANAGGPYTINEGESLTLDASGSTDPDTDPLTYRWDLDNDGNFTEAGEPTGVGPTVNWSTLQSFGINDDGTYTVGLQVDDGNGGVVTTTATVTVNDVAPTISVNGTSSALAGSAYTLNLSATDPGDDTITGWIIDWGDGSVETIAGSVSAASHTYADGGRTYNVLVAAVNEDGTWHESDLFVAGRISDAIHRFDPVTGASSLDIDLSPTSSPHTLAFGPDGLLYASDNGTNEIYRFNPSTGALVSTFVPAGTGGLTGPEGIAFGRDGNLYVADKNTDRIFRFDGTTGTFVDVFATVGPGTTGSRTAIQFLGNGDLLVARQIDNHVLRVDGTTGAVVGEFVAANSGGLSEPRGLDIGADGHLYVTSSGTNEVLRYNGATGAFIDVFVSANSGGLTLPSDLTFGPDGHLYVSSQNTDQVLRYDGSTGAFLSVYASGGTLDSARGLVFNPAHQVTVANSPVGTTTDADSNANSVSEHATVGTTVGVTASATDPDALDTVTYSLDDSAGARFAINGSTGVVTVAAALDHETNASHDITVRATSTDGSSTTNTFTIDVADVDEAPTVTGPTLVSVAEDATNGTTVTSFTGVDPEGAGSLTWSILESVPFTMTGGGDLIVNGPLDFETTTAYTVTVRATDFTGNHTDHAVTIDVTNANEAPVISGPATFSLPENQAAGPLLATYSSSDVDAGDTITYSLTGTTAFAINATTGELRATGPFDHETTPSVTFNVVATDNGGLVSSRNVTATITNVNELPSITGPATVAVSDAVTPGTSIATFPTTDPDVTGAPSWAVIGSGPFTMGGNSLIVTGPLDANVTPSYTLTIRVTDDGGLTADHVVTVNVTDGNVAPVLSGPAALNVNENSAAGTSLGTYSATDANAGDTVSFSLVEAVPFAINATTGELTVNGPLNFEATPSYTFTVRADDGQGGIDTQSVTVTINDVNETPSITGAATLNVAENTTVGTVLSTYSATDPDAADTLTYSIVEAGLPFTINATNGQLSLAAALDYETTNSYSLTIRVSDGNGGVADQSVNVTVTNTNEPPVLAGPATHTVAESTALGTSLGTYSATDVDGNPITFSIVEAGQPFAINATTGELTVNGPLDFEATPSYTFTVRADDGQGGLDTQSVTVNLTNVNEPPSIVGSAAVSVAEDAAVGTTFATYSVTDPDAGDTVMWSIIGVVPFTISPTGDLTVDASLDRETTPSYTFTLRATDASNATDDFTVTVTIADANEAPVAADDSFTLAEDGSLTINVLANDTDPDGNPLTTILLSGPANGTVVHNPDNTFTYTPDANFNGVDAFTYQATDGTLTSSATVSLTVTPQNDAPTLTGGSRTVTAGTANGTLVLDLVEADIDGDPLSFSIISGNTGGAFAIGAGAQLTVADSNALNASVATSWTLVVQAHDGTVGTTATVTLTLGNSAPIAANDLATVAEDGSVRIDVLANDSDPDGDTMTTSLVTGPSNGSVTRNGDGSFTYIPNANYNGPDSFRYAISDGVLTAQAIVDINVSPTNDAPVFGGTTLYTAAFGERLDVDAAAGLLRNATDVDGDALTVVLVTAPTYGAVTVNPDGSFVYEPATNQQTDEFFVAISDGTTQTGPVRIQVDALVAPAPTAGAGGGPTSAASQADSGSTTSGSSASTADSSDSSYTDSTDSSSSRESGTESTTDYESESTTDSSDAGDTATPSEEVQPAEEAATEQATTESAEQQQVVEQAADAVAEAANQLAATPAAAESTSNASASAATSSGGFAGIAPDGSSMIGDFGDRSNANLGGSESAGRTAGLTSFLTSWWDADNYAAIDVNDPNEAWRQRVITNAGITQAIDEVEDSVSGARPLQTAVGRVVTVTGSAATVGYVVMAIRSGALVTGLLAQMPAWRIIDPLVVLEALEDPDGESLESMIEDHQSNEPAGLET